MQRYRDCSGHRNAHRIADRNNAQSENAPSFGQLLGHAIERIHVGTAAEQALPEHDDEHNPDGRHEPPDHLAQHQHNVDGLEDGHQPDLVNGDDVDGRSRDEDAQLVVDLQPAILRRFVHAGVLEEDELELWGRNYNI